MLDDYIDDVTGTIRATLGQADPPHFFLTQINSADTRIETGQADPYNLGVVLAQLDVARDRLGRGVTLAGPAYQVQVSDNIHHDSRGRLMLGELFALAYRRVGQGRWFTPLWPTRATLDGRRIDVTFDLPGDSLQFDTDWVKPVPHQGFNYLDDSASATVTSVSLVGTDTVRILLDRTPDGTSPRIRYACANEDPSVDDGWSAARGQLYSDSGVASNYADTFGIPKTIRHYAVRFELPL